MTYSVTVYTTKGTVSLIVDIDGLIKLIDKFGAASVCVVAVDY